MKTAAIVIVFALVVMLAPAPAGAHPGHGGLDGGSIAHHLLELPHAVWIVAAMVVVAGWLVLRARRRQ